MAPRAARERLLHDHGRAVVGQHEDDRLRPFALQQRKTIYAIHTRHAGVEKDDNRVFDRALHRLLHRVHFPDGDILQSVLEQQAQPGTEHGMIVDQDDVGFQHARH